VLDLRVMLISEEGAEGWAGEVGRLTHDRLRELLDGLDPRRTLALICGPGPMVSALSDNLLDLGLPINKVIYERFDYAGGASRQDRQRARRFLLIGAGLAAVVGGFALFS
jgi:NAD(P)H-flavin reductase